MFKKVHMEKPGDWRGFVSVAADGRGKEPFPTPLGIAHIRHQKGKGGKITTTANAPEGITIVRE